jgi:DNA repair protein RadC
MEIQIYDIINNPLPQLYTLKTIKVKESDFLQDDSIVKIMNKYLLMDKLASEHIYALGLTYSLIPKGIIQVSIGEPDGCVVNLKQLATGLLLMGTEQFICFHNHPGGMKKISKADRELTDKYKEIGQLLNIDFLNHIMITKDYYDYCESDKKEIIFGQEV